MRPVLPGMPENRFARRPVRSAYMLQVDTVVTGCCPQNCTVMHQCRSVHSNECPLLQRSTETASAGPIMRACARVIVRHAAVP
jgi:hypothetical protein